MAISHHDVCTRRILVQLEACDSISQRALSRELGIALGLTNTLLRRMIRSGWVEVVRQAPNRVRYVITSAGVAHEAVMSRDYFQDAVRRYRETRDRIRQSLRALSVNWPADDAQVSQGKPIVFYGTGEVAEIAFVSLQEVDLRLVGVVDERCSGTFFGLPVHPVERLTTTDLEGRPFDRLIVMAFDDARRVPPPLVARGFPIERVSWL